MNNGNNGGFEIPELLLVVAGDFEDKRLLFVLFACLILLPVILPMKLF